jgi:protein-S-isoprenylcysteine O-methyltransferase Ste14
MAGLALALIVVWVVVVGAARGMLHARATGETGVRLSDRPGSPQWWARATGTLGFVLLVLVPVAELAGLPALAPLDIPALRAAGAVVVVLGIAGSVVSQSAMGSSWRADVDPAARTALVTGGPFRWVRNPIFTASAVVSVGVALMVPNALALLMLVVMVMTYQIQVRLVEEPYLRRVHGDAYRGYSERVGRFIPLVGRERRRPSS